VHAGLYEALLTLATQQNLDQLSDPRLYSLAPVDCEDAHSALAQFLEHALASSLATFRGAESAERQKRLVDRIIGALTDELGTDWTKNLSISTPLRRLLAIHADPRETPEDRPDTPLARSALLTGTRLDPSLGSQLRKEIATADRIDILCSFVKWSGLRTLIDALRQLAAQPFEDGPRIRVITTSYMGATDPRAVEALSALPNTEIRVSYDTKRTRLHAKAYIFHRDSGFGSRARSRPTGRMMSLRYSAERPPSACDGPSAANGPVRVGLEQQLPLTCALIRFKRRSLTSWPPSERSRTNTAIWSSRRPGPARR
jgi:hypothetical protein